MFRIPFFIEPWLKLDNFSLARITEILRYSYYCFSLGRYEVPSACRPKTRAKVAQLRFLRRISGYPWYPLISMISILYSTMTYSRSVSLHKYHNLHSYTYTWMTDIQNHYIKVEASPTIFPDQGPGLIRTKISPNGHHLKHGHTRYLVNPRTCFGLSVSHASTTIYLRKSSNFQISTSPAQRTILDLWFPIWTQQPTTTINPSISCSPSRAFPPKLPPFNPTLLSKATFQPRHQRVTGSGWWWQRRLFNVIVSFRFVFVCWVVSTCGILSRKRF